MEMDKWVLGTIAFIGGAIVGRNWKKIAAYTGGFYNKNVKKIFVKPTKALSKKSVAKVPA